MTLKQFSEKPTVNEVRSALLEAGSDYAALRAKPAAERGDTYEADVREHATFIRDADLILTALERGASVLPDPGTGILNPNTNGGPNAATGYGAERRTIGQLVANDEGYQSFAGARASGATFHEVNIPGSVFQYNSQFRAQIDSSSPQGGGAFLPQAPNPIAPNVRQMRLFLRDVLSVQATNLASVPYIREVSPVDYELGASSVMEGAQKPEVVLDWVLDDAPVRKIAAWVPVTTEIIDDATTLQGYIDGRLAYMLAVREEQQILNGSGTAPQLKGVLQYSDTQNQTFASTLIATIGLGVGKIEAVDGEADGIVMHPTAYWTLMTTRHATQFDGSGSAGGLPYEGTPSGLWGLPVIRSRAVSATQSIVGSWRLGATLFDRMQTTIKIGNQHSDYFTNNKVAVLAEERVALAVHRPDFFCTINHS